MGGEKSLSTSASIRRLGSPPHGRGKACGPGLLDVVSGITPAWAGKRQPKKAGKRRKKDHPRMGGEKCAPLTLKGGRQGSPPRRRGKVQLVECILARAGITPAWAGKRNCRTIAPSRRGDHPRMGGEKEYTELDSVRRLGSPLRGRGKGLAHVRIACRVRITPAWAGKSLASQPWSPPLWMMVIRPRP